MNSFVRPLSSGELIEMARDGEPIPADRVLATFADESNWTQIYRGEASPGCGYKALACEWAFVGPVRPPFELAQHATSAPPRAVRIKDITEQGWYWFHIQPRVSDFVDRIQLELGPNSGLVMWNYSRRIEEVEGWAIRIQAPPSISWPNEVASHKCKYCNAQLTGETVICGGCTHDHV